MNCSHLKTVIDCRSR